MYIPNHHAETDIAVLQALITSHPLGAWITTEAGALVANHLPFLLEPSRGAYGTLVGHVARANPIWRSFSRTEPSLVIFQGAQTYITPSWYPSKHVDARAVPTWNYAVVHVTGAPIAIEDPSWLAQHVSALTDHHEAPRSVPWKVSDAPPDFTARLLEAIVGIEIPIATIVGKWKVSQNRPDHDKLGVMSGLSGRGGETALEMASLVKRSVRSAPLTEQ